MGGKAHRAGAYHCRSCRGQFTVTVGTVMEDSHLPLSKWALAFHYMASSKKGVSALQLMRNLGLGSYRTAWHMAHRIREAMKPVEVEGDLLGGIVEVDEAYVGGKPRPGDGKVHKRGRGTSKAPVMVLVERNGRAISKHLPQVDANNLQMEILENVHPSAAIMTDENPSYKGIDKHFDGGHGTVNHSKKQYAVGSIHSNTAESYFRPAQAWRLRHLPQPQQEAPSPLLCGVRFPLERSPDDGRRAAGQRNQRGGGSPPHLQGTGCKAQEVSREAYRGVLLLLLHGLLGHYLPHPVGREREHIAHRRVHFWRGVELGWLGLSAHDATANERSALTDEW